MALWMGYVANTRTVKKKTEHFQYRINQHKQCAETSGAPSNSFWQQIAIYSVPISVLVFEVYQIAWGRAHAARRISDKAIKEDREEQRVRMKFLGKTRLKLYTDILDFKLIICGGLHEPNDYFKKF